MKKIIILFVLFLSSTTMAKLPRSFTGKKIMKLDTGMSSHEILKMFGTPSEVERTTCGTATSEPWSCLIWRYGSFLSSNASFTFSIQQHRYILNNFEIKRSSL